MQYLDLLYMFVHLDSKNIQQAGFKHIRGKKKKRKLESNWGVYIWVWIFSSL